MNDLDHLKSGLDDGWSPERQDALSQRIVRTLQRRQRARRVLAVAAAVVLLGAAGIAAAMRLVGPPTGDASPPVAMAPVRPPGPAAAAGELRFSDGSTATALDGQSRLVALADGPHLITVALERGSARFEVVPNPARRFRVEVLPLTVEVIGTRFTVERQAEHMRVSVERGRVRVGEQDLTAGQSGLFPFALPPAPAPESAPAPAPPAAPRPAKAAVPDWRSLARDGEFDAAWARLEAGTIVRDEPHELLLASDVARLSGHPSRAVGYLQQLNARHARDPRAPLGAFTLGRVLLDELGRPREAALAFARARALDEVGPLAEDALGREVEAWARAGEVDLARAAAERYLASYPNGQRATSVRRHGGLR